MVSVCGLLFLESGPLKSLPSLSLSPSPFPRKEQRNYYNQVANEESIYASLQEVTSAQ